MIQLNWVSYSFIALFLFSLMVTLITFLAKKGLSIQLILFFLFALATVLYGLQAYFTSGFHFTASPSIIFSLVLIGVLSFLGNFAQFQASTTAPNAGLAIAIVSVQAIVVGLLSFIFFQQSVNAKQIVGMFLAIAGVVIISLGSK